MNRRDLLQLAAMMLTPAGASLASRSAGATEPSASAVATVPPANAAPVPAISSATTPVTPPAAPEVSAVMTRLSDYMSAARDRPVPDAVLEQTVNHIVDTLAAMISGSRLPPGLAALGFAKDYGGPPTSTVVSARFLRGPIEAAMTNGMLAHADETDDSHSPSQSHPGCAVIPAALAVGEKFGISGRQFLRAVTLGYDIGTRVTMTLGGQRFEADSHWSTHSIAPLFCAAAAAGCAAGCNAQQMRWLLSYTAHQSSGLGAWNRDKDHVQKAFHFGGMTARSGVTSALLVRAGWTGVEDILSGKDNFFAAYNPHADPAGLVDGLGERYEVTRTNIKKWAVGSPIQAILDALELLRKERPIAASEVRAVEVRLATDEAAIVDDRPVPDICLQHVLAVALVDGGLTFASIHDAGRMQDPAVLTMRAKIRLLRDPDLQRLMPLRVGVLDLNLADGSHLERRVDNVRGTPSNPMTRDEVLAKARDLIVPVLGAAKSAKLLRQLVDLDSLGNLRSLRPLLQT